MNVMPDGARITCITIWETDNDFGDLLALGIRGRALLLH